MHCTILCSVAQLDCVVVALLENVTGRKLESAAGQTKVGIIERSLAATTTRMCLIRVMRALDRPDGAAWAIDAARVETVTRRHEGVGLVQSRRCASMFDDVPLRVGHSGRADAWRSGPERACGQDVRVLSITILFSLACRRGSEASRCRGWPMNLLKGEWPGGSIMLSYERNGWVAGLMCSEKGQLFIVSCRHFRHKCSSIS